MWRRQQRPGRRGDKAPRCRGGGTGKNAKSARGQWAEEAAVRHLTAHGLVCRERNFRSRFGEIDLIMEDGAEVVFVEVRSRAARGFMHPAESVDPAKCRRIAHTAGLWLRSRCADRGAPEPACRFDVLAITGETDAPDIRWIRSAFDA